MGSVILSLNAEITDDKCIRFLITKVHKRNTAVWGQGRTGRNVGYCGLLLYTVTEIEANKIHCF